jgi:hypothetical protein
MKYDITALQAFQYAMEKIEKEPITDQAGICYYIMDFYDAWKDKYHKDIGYRVIEWMRDTYFPGVLPGEYWWPTSFYESDKKRLADSKIKRIAFLQRIIEDLMCGGPA